MTKETENWSSLDQVAEYIGVNKDTIRNWLRKNAIPARKIGKLWKFKLSEVDEWVQSGKSADIK
jgi:excisionase family DNA binding protein